MVRFLFVLAAFLALPIVATIAETGGRDTMGVESASQPSKSCRIKGNISSSGERIYHVPGGQYYDVTRISRAKGERWFCSQAEARKAGWRRSLR